MIYLASPYSDPSSDVRHDRFLAAKAATMRLLKAGHLVFSPITYSHQFADLLGTDFEAWRTFDLAMIDCCDELWVLKLGGYFESSGVWNELEYANAIGKPVKYLDPTTLEAVE
jgi:nucleoside 2-deoxyribosyltransferase